MGRLFRVLSKSGFRMEETPGHGADVVEELESGYRSVSVEGTFMDEEPEVGVDLLSGAVRNTVVVKSISACSAGALSEVCWH